MASVGSALGVGSGLELSTLLTNLMAAEKIPLTKLQAQEATVQSKISAFGQLKSALASLRDTVNGLTTAKFNGLTASSADAQVVTATATNKASKATHTLEVISLAQAEKAVSAPLADGKAKTGVGTLTFTLGSVKNGSFVPGEGEAKTVTIDATNNTLEGVRDAINKAKVGVTASLVNEGSGTRLVLTSDETGAANAFKITTTGTATGGGKPLSFLDYDPSTAVSYADNPTASEMSRLQAGADAQLKLDGLSITSASNTVADVAEGVSFKLLKAGTTTVSISGTSADGTAALKSLVDAYNSFLKTANSLAVNTPSKVKGEAGTTGPLAGDSVVRDAISRIRAEIFNPVQGATGAYTSLASLGVSFQSDGTLKLDTSRLDKAMAEDPAAISQLFASEPYGEGTQGITERFAAQLSAFIDTNGTIDSRVSGLNDTTKTLQTQQAQLETRLTEIEARYRQQFTALDTLLTQLNSTSSFLSQQLDALKNLNG